MVFSPDGRTLVSASADQTIRLWDVSDPAHAKPIGRPLRGHTQEVWRLALLPDGKTLVSGAKDGSICLWDTSIPRKDESHTVTTVRGWGFDNGGASALTVAPDGHVVRRDGRDFQRWHHVIAIGNHVARGAFYEHGHFLSAWCSDGTWRIWDLHSMRELHPHPYGCPDFAALTPERRFLLFFAADNEAVEWDPMIGSGNTPWHPAGGINAYASTADGRWRLALSFGGVGAITDAANGRQTALNLDTREVGDACFSPDGSLLAIASKFGFVKLWKTADLTLGGELPMGVKLSGFALAAHSLAFSPDGGRLAAGGQGSEAVKLYDVNSRQEVLTLPVTGQFFFNHTEFSPDGNELASSNQTGELHLWRAPTLAEIEAVEANQADR